jgi:glycosyltransferase involved in cell wall biosynthesis/tetratricopeptide (TPR) repeat protein
MIVRNEGQTLERCLSSVAPFVDEIVIGLAGKSTDDTEAIARKFTDQVFDIIWKDDFSYARNLVLDRVTGDYFLWLDGDDIISGAEKFPSYIERYPDVGAFHVGWDFAQDEHGNSVTYLIRERLVRMDLGWHWNGRVHEALITEQPHSAHLIEDIVVKHDLKAHQDRRGTRNLDLLYKDLEETEPNPPQRLLLYLGNENASRGNFKEALLHWRRFMAGARWDEETYQIAHKIADVYRAMGDLDRAEQADFEAIKIAPHWPDAYFGLAQTAYERGRWQEVVEWTKAAGTKSAPQTQLIVNPRDYDFHPLQTLGVAYARMGFFEEALDNLSRAYAIKPDEALLEVIQACRYETDSQKVLNAFMTIYSHLGRHDEWLKARQLFAVAPKILEKHPDVQEAWWRTEQSTAHIDDPQIMVDFYVNNPHWAPMDEERIKDPEWLNYPRLAFARSVAENIGAEEILDLGCSDGFMALPLASLGHSVMGVDLDPRCVSLATSRAAEWGLDEAIFRQGTIDDVEIEDEKFDLALAFEIIEHVVDVGDFLDRLEKRANHIAITTPFMAWEQGNIPEWNKVEPKGHLRIFDLPDVERELSGRGKIYNLYREPWGRSAWIFADYEVGASWDKNITILTGGTLEEWGPRKLAEQGLGGSETAVIKLGENLAKLGHKTTVYGRIDSTGVYGGVTYRDNDAFIPDVRSQMLIAWRSPEVADLSPNADTLVLWMHDTDAADRLTESRARAFDKIVVLSEWHRSHMMRLYPFIPEEKYVIIGNGIDLERFTGGSGERDNRRVVYSSSPDRGLDVVLEHIWPLVTSAVPDATLHVYYGWASFDAASRAYPHLRDFKARVSDLLLRNINVVQHGRVDPDTLAKEFEKSSVWLYPTYFPETYCITAVEAQLAGMVPITNHLAALKETVGENGIVIEGDVKDPKVAAEYARQVIAILCEPDRPEEREKIKKNAKARSWGDIAEDWVSLM